jgi:hypothetical protein
MNRCLALGDPEQKPRLSLAGKNEATVGVFGTGRSPRPANNILDLNIAP